MRFDVAVPPDVSTIDMPRISPDGKTLAFDATDTTGRNRIWIRPLNALAPHPLPGTEGTKRVFWSPDSRFLGFMADGKLMKIDVAGGPPTKICDAPTGADGTWCPDGTILFDGTGTDPIYRVPASGGNPTVLVKAEAARKETQVGWPEILPDGKHFLYMAIADRVADSVYRIASLDGKENRTFAPAQSAITYAEPGYILYLRDRTLVAQPFDAKALKTTGEPMPVAEQVGTDSVGAARFSISREGTLAYRTGEINDRLVWVDRTGKELETLGDAGQYRNPALSPDGTRLAFEADDPRSGKADIWIRDLARGVNSRFTFGSANSTIPMWSPDGLRLAYSTGIDLYEKPTNGQGAETLLVKSDEFKVVDDWSEGRIAFISRSRDTNWDLWTLPTGGGERKPAPWLKTPFAEVSAAFSPDGRFIAYQSNESGRAEIYVQSFPEPGGKWQVSTSGGSEPHWRGDGKELFYRSPDQKLMAVDVQTSPGFQAGIPKALFSVRLDAGIARNHFVPARDGQRFLLVATPSRESVAPTTVVLNWLGELGR
jgi:Tol biopolymer transport system component